MNCAHCEPFHLGWLWVFAADVKTRRVARIAVRCQFCNWRGQKG